MNVRRVIFLEKNVCAHQNNETILSRLILQILVSCESRKQYFENISSKITVWDHLLNLNSGGYILVLVLVLVVDPSVVGNEQVG